MATAEAVLSRIDIPEREQKEILELYRKAVLEGTGDTPDQPKGRNKEAPRGSLQPSSADP